MDNKKGATLLGSSERLVAIWKQLEEEQKAAEIRRYMPSMSEPIHPRSCRCSECRREHPCG